MKTEAHQRTGFLGRGWTFPPEFDRNSGEVRMLEGEADIRSSLQVLLATQAGERFLRPQYGANLAELMFEPLDASLRSSLRKRLIDLIYLHEPRVEPTDLRFEEDREGGCIQIHVDYRVISTNTRHNLVYPYYLQEGTNIARP